MEKIIECVPNFSEGHDDSVIKAITDAIESVDDVFLLHVDKGIDANRTVVTFAGDADKVGEAAFRAVKTASERIDMRTHKGEHPRIGASDVFPFVPISGVTMDDAVNIARHVSERVGRELGIPVYCYENAAFSPQRRNLAECRRGEYESLAAKITTDEWRPDFGPDTFTETAARSGASVIGAREFLLAVNFNLETDSVETAKKIAATVRESGRIIDTTEGKKRVGGMLKGVKAIGWYMEQFGCAQVSTNITDINATPLHIAFDTISQVALKNGTCVTGCEVIGMLPLRVLKEAGIHYSGNPNLSEEELVDNAVEAMRLTDVTRFDKNKKIIEYVLRQKQKA